jgi:hypothetical protein
LVGDRDNARLLYAKLLTQLQAGDGDRAELARARAALR